MRCPDCGRKALAVPRNGRGRSRAARAGRPVALKGHTLCQRCFESLADSCRAARLEPFFYLEEWAMDSKIELTHDSITLNAHAARALQRLLGGMIADAHQGHDHAGSVAVTNPDGPGAVTVVIAD